jgi:two-component system invasion response regulator UvrY
MPVATSVALVDDHQLFLDGLRAVIGTYPDLRVVAACNSGRQALEVLSKARADVIVLDLMMPGISGITLARELMRNDSQTRLLALSMGTDEPSVAEAFGAGVLGYACKSQPAAEVLDAIREVAKGASYIAPQLAERFPHAGRDVRAGRAAHPLDRLTQREREVFDLTVSGLSTRDVAKELSISARTVETHRSRLLHKLNARSALELVRMAATWRMLPQ